MSQATAAHRTTLVSAASTLGLDLADAQIDLLLAYMDWLHKWNKVYNLTALRHPDEMLSHHLIDSLTAIAPLQRHIANQRQQGALWLCACPTSRGCMHGWKPCRAGSTW